MRTAVWLLSLLWQHLTSKPTEPSNGPRWLTTPAALSWRSPDRSTNPTRDSLRQVVGGWDGLWGAGT